MNKETKLSPAQLKLYEFIWDRANWRHPTHGQIMEAFGYSSPGTAHRMLMEIKRKGFDIPFLKDKKVKKVEISGE